jgi:hypothetical protein
MIQILATVTISVALFWLLVAYCERTIQGWAGRVLGAVKVLGDGITPVDIYYLSEATGRPLSYAEIYEGLDRLEELRMVRTWREPGGPERGNRERVRIARI